MERRRKSVLVLHRAVMLSTETHVYMVRPTPWAEVFVHTWDSSPVDQDLGKPVKWPHRGALRKKKGCY